MRANFGRLTSLYLRPLFLGAVLMGCVFALPAMAGAAGLTVQILKPTTTPTFTFRLNQEYDFEAVAFAQGAELEGGQVTWEWNFGDSTPHSPDNPTVHTYLYSRNFTVTVTARYQGLSGQATINAAAAAGGLIDGFEVVAAPGGGGEVCDHVEIQCRQSETAAENGSLQSAHFYRKQGTDWVDLGTVSPQFRQVGQDWYWVAALGWPTWNDLNHEAVTWRIAAQFWVPPPPGEQGPYMITLTKEAAWTPHNTVLTGADECLIQHTVGETAHEVQFHIDHLRDTDAGIDPKYLVTLTVYDLGGTQVAQVTKDNVTLGDGSITWEPQFAVPGDDPPPGPGQTVDADAIYTYRLTAAHGVCQDTWPSQATAFTAPVDLSGVRFDAANLRLIGTVRGTLSRPPAQTNLIIYPPGLANPITISGGAGQPNPEEGIPIGEVPVPPDKMGDWIVVMLPVDSDEAGELNPGREPRPGMPGGGKLQVLPTSCCLRGSGEANPKTEAIQADAHTKMSQSGPGSSYRAPAYVCSDYSGWAKPMWLRLGGVGADGKPTTDRDAIVFYVGHAEPGVLHVRTNIDLFYKLYAGTSQEHGDTQYTHYDRWYLRDHPGGTLGKCRLAFLLGCGTGISDVDGHNLLTDCREYMGAACALGPVKVWIGQDTAQSFAAEFWRRTMEEGATIQEAFDGALQVSGTGDEDWAFSGDKMQVLRPASYR